MRATTNVFTYLGEEGLVKLPAARQLGVAESLGARELSIRRILGKRLMTFLTALDQDVDTRRNDFSE